MATLVVAPNLFGLIVRNALEQLVLAVGPFLGHLLAILLVGLGFRWLLKPLLPKSKKKRGH